MIELQSDFNILVAILDKDDNKKGVFKGYATTTKEIKKKTNYGHTKIYSGLKTLMNKGLIDYGLKKGNCKTYIVTEKGMKEIKLLRKGEDELC